MYPFTGLDYWTEIFPFLDKFLCLILERSLHFLQAASTYLATIYDCNNCLLQCFQQYINLQLCYRHLINKSYMICVSL